MPARRTIERILQRAGRTAHPTATTHERSGVAYPVPRAKRVGAVHETDLVGPRHLRTARGPLRFYSFHTVDVAGGGIATWQGPDKSAESYCRYLAEVAWLRLGLPGVWQVDNAIALLGYESAGRIFTQPVRLALLLGVEVRFIPQGEPGRNADVESFNALWQARVLRRFATPSLARLAAVSGRFERWWMTERPHPKLSLAAHGTRFPAELLVSLDGSLPRLPGGFRLEARISWVRRTDEHGRLALLGRRLALGRAAANQYVVATLSTGRGEVAVRVDQRVIKLFNFGIRERVVQPLRRGH